MELSSKIKGLKFMRRAEDAKARAGQSPDVRLVPHPTHLPPPSTATPPSTVTPPSVHKGSLQQEAPRFVVQYEPCLSALLQPDVRSSRALHKDYAPLSKASTLKDVEGGEQQGGDADGDVTMEQRKSADEKKVISKGMAAGRNHPRPPSKRFGGHSSPKKGQGGSKGQPAKKSSKAK